MAELRQVIREVKQHIENGHLSGREFADAVFAAFEAIDHPRDSSWRAAAYLDRLSVAASRPQHPQLEPVLARMAGQGSIRNAGLGIGHSWD